MKTKKEKLAEALTGLDETLIAEAAEYKVDKRRKLKVFGAVAACFVLVSVAGVVLARHFRVGPDDSVVSDCVMNMIDYDNAYYEIIDDPQILAKNGIYEEITKEHAGTSITYLKHSSFIEGVESSCYVPTENETDFELMTYVGTDSKAVRVFRMGDEYEAALFTSYHTDVYGEGLPLTESFEVYGIESAEDIKSVTIGTDLNAPVNFGEVGKVVTDPEELIVFYNEMIGFKSYTLNELENLTTADGEKIVITTPDGDKSVSSSNWVKYMMDGLVVETEEGLKLQYTCYESNLDGKTEGEGQWLVYDSETMCYHVVSADFHEWADRNLGKGESQNSKAEAD